MLRFTSRTYAPKKETPVLRHKLSHEHLSVISGITEQGRLYIQVREKSFNGPDVVEFLQHLLRHVSGKLLVIWDGSPIHRGKDVKNFLLEEANGRVQLERLPPYSPDLNPDEGIWQYLKCVCLKNICCKDLTHLKRELKRAIRTLRSRKQVIFGCFKRMEFV